MIFFALASAGSISGNSSDGFGATISFFSGCLPDDFAVAGFAGTVFTASDFTLEAGDAGAAFDAGVFAGVTNFFSKADAVAAGFLETGGTALVSFFGASFFAAVGFSTGLAACFTGPVLATGLATGLAGAALETVLAFKGAAADLEAFFAGVVFTTFAGTAFLAGDFFVTALEPAGFVAGFAGAFLLVEALADFDFEGAALAFFATAI
jgi:hypothetical protein